jgi:GntR family transcriptional regulator, transcriptional repressor for pyruvate dehydrogenase complex
MTLAAPMTEAVIRRIRDLIGSGGLPPGARLPSEAELAAQLGASRNTVREAVRALVTARVLDVRRGDGTYVTSLRPELLLEGIGFAADMLQPDYALELVGVRRILEPAATALAAARIDMEALASLADCLERMRGAASQEVMVQYDAQFHATVAGASGNTTLASMLAGVSGRSQRARIWRGIVDADAVARTIAQHQDILRALEARDPVLAEAAAVVHVATTEAWLREIVTAPGPRTEEPARPTRRGRPRGDT